VGKVTLLVVCEKRLAISPNSKVNFFSVKGSCVNTGTSIKRGGLGGSVKCPKSNLQPLFQVGYVMAFGEHSKKHPHTKFQTQILMYGKAAALGSLLHTPLKKI
jgi:hypothetical protein